MRKIFLDIALLTGFSFVSWSNCFSQTTEVSLIKINSGDNWTILPFMKSAKDKSFNEGQIAILHEMQRESRAYDKALRALNQLYEAQYVPSFEKDEEIFA